MKLFLADIHLYRSRLFGSQRSDASGQNYPWESPAAATKNSPTPSAPFWGMTEG